MIQLTNDKNAPQFTLEQQLGKLPQPEFRIEFIEIESWNHILSISRSKNFRTPSPAEGEIAKWRKKGFEKAIFYARRFRHEIYEWTEFNEKGKPKAQHSKIKSPIFSRCDVVLRFWRPDWTDFDVFSPVVKPIFDGFVDAGVLSNDSFKFVPKFTTEFMGVDTDLKLSDEAKENRTAKRRIVKKSLLKPSRFYFDFYSIPF